MLSRNQAPARLPTEQMASPSPLDGRQVERDVAAFKEVVSGNKVAWTAGKASWITVSLPQARQYVREDTARDRPSLLNLFSTHWSWAMRKV